MTATIAEAISRANAELQARDIPDAPRDSRRLVAFAAGLEMSRLTLHLREPMTAEAEVRLDAALSARIKRRPVSQIVGERVFWGRPFAVSSDVLDPRPETETLVETALEARFSRVLDLGTGSGILAITLLAERTSTTAVATDISDAALGMARRNAEAHRVGDRLTFIKTDWATDVAGRFDLIVSNPPYIAAHEMAGLAPEIREHEPAVALTDGGDGLGAYRRIAADAPRLLAPGGRLAVEIGIGQQNAVCALFEQSGLAVAGARPDMDGRPRVIRATIRA